MKVAVVVATEWPCAPRKADKCI